MNTINKFITQVQHYAKLIVAAVGSILTAVSGLSADLGITIIPDGWNPYITLGLAVLTSIATWAVPNTISDEQISRDYDPEL